MDVEPGFRSSMMERAAKLEGELQELIAGFFAGKVK